MCVWVFLLRTLVQGQCSRFLVVSVFCDGFAWKLPAGWVRPDVFAEADGGTHTHLTVPEDKSSWEHNTHSVVFLYFSAWNQMLSTLSFFCWNHTKEYFVICTPAGLQLQDIRLTGFLFFRLSGNKGSYLCKNCLRRYHVGFASLLELQFDALF